MFECISIESLTDSNIITGCDDPIWPDVVRSGIVRMRRTRTSNTRTQQVQFDIGTHSILLRYGERVDITNTDIESIGRDG